jgi:Flp pilus assembly pilin Flp
MLQYLNQRRGQSTLEYAVLIVVIIGALLTIQVYIKRGVQGRLKQATDDIGDQYSDGNTNLIKTTIRNSTTEEIFNAGSASSTIQNGGELTNTTEKAVIVNVQQEYWGNTAT